MAIDMKRRTRHILFLCFLSAFVIAAPLVVLYTAGYRYSFAARRVVQTGILSLGSVPKGAMISIDDEPLRPTTPSVVKNVLPGEHLVRVEKDGYSSWQKRLSVASRETTFADDVVLFLTDTPTIVEETPLAAVGVHPTNGSAAYAKIQGQWTEVWIKDARDGTDRLVSRLPVGASSAVSLSWRNDGSALAIESNGPTRSLTLVDATTGAPVEPVSPDGLSLTSASNHVAVARQDGGASVILAYVPIGTYRFDDAPEGMLLLRDDGRDRVLVLQAGGGDQPILLSARATFWQWEPGGRRLLYTDGFDLHVYDASSHSDETITRLSTPITGIGWYPGHAYALYAIESAIYAMELDHRDARNVTALASGTSLGAFAVDRDGGVLRFFGEVSGVGGLFEKRVQR